MDVSPSKDPMGNTSVETRAARSCVMEYLLMHLRSGSTDLVWLSKKKKGLNVGARAALIVGPRGRTFLGIQSHVFSFFVCLFHWDQVNTLGSHVGIFTCKC